MTSKKNTTSTPVRHRLIFKLVFYFTCAVLISSAISGHFSIKITEKEFNKMLVEQFQSSIETSENFISFLGQTAMIWSNQIAKNHKLQSLFAQNDKETIISLGQTFLSETTADILIVLDNQGNIILKSNDLNKTGSSLLYWDIVRHTVLEGTPTSSIVQDNENFIIYSSGIVYPEDGSHEVQGILLLGYELNDTFLNEIKNNVHTHITIIRDRAVMASSFNIGDNRLRTVPIPYIEYQMLLAKPQNISNMTLLDDEYFIAARNLKMMDKRMSGSMMIAYPTEEMEKIENRIAWGFGLIFFISFLLVVIIGVYISEKVTSPIHKLAEQMQNITADRPSSNVSVKTNDEIGVLADHFNQMIEAVKRKNKDLHTHSENLEQKVITRTQELNLANKKTEAILRSIGEGVIAIDENSKILYVNKEFLEIFEYAKDEIINKHIHMLMPKKYRHPYTKRMDTCSSSENISNMFRGRHEMEGLRSDGSIFPLELNIEETIVDSDTRFFTAACRDISDRQRKEEALKSAKEVAEAALLKVKQLSGILPICCHCNKIRDDGDHWQDVAVYIDRHSEAEFSHGICPQCLTKHYSDVIKQ